MHQILSRFIRNKMFGQSFEVDKVQDELDRLVEVCNLYVWVSINYKVKKLTGAPALSRRRTVLLLWLTWHNSARLASIQLFSRWSNWLKWWCFSIFGIKSKTSMEIQWQRRKTNKFLLVSWKTWRINPSKREKSVIRWLNRQRPKNIF